MREGAGESVQEIRSLRALFLQSLTLVCKELTGSLVTTSFTNHGCVKACKEAWYRINCIGSAQEEVRERKHCLINENIFKRNTVR